MKRFWVLLGLVLILAAGARAEADYGPVEERVYQPIESDAALEGYIDSRFFPEERVVPKAWQLPLTGKEKELYDVLLPLITKVSDGQRESTIFTIDAATFFSGYRFDSKEELGEWVRGLTRSVVDLLFHSCAYELYWYDNYWWYNYWYNSDSGGYYLTQNFIVRFQVAEEYRQNDEFTVSTRFGQTVRTAVANAKAIVEQHAGKSDLEKLRAYKNTICDLTDYNHSAWADGRRLIPYGNPWQMVWVFDGDPETKVVCEGYSKAFMYLCQLSSFRRNVRVYCASGPMNGEGHMWNMVTMEDGLSYFVDVTVADGGSKYNDETFMIGYSRKNSDRSFVLDYYNRSNSYDFDDYFIHLAEVAALSVASRAYVAPQEITPGWSEDGAGRRYILPDGSFATERTDIDGNTYFFDDDGYMVKNCWRDNCYFGNDGAMLRDAWVVDDLEFWRLGDDGTVEEYIDEPLVIPRGVTEIDDEAFRGVAASAIFIPREVKSIGAKAFADCPNLRVICFEAYETVDFGEDAFSGCDNVEGFVTWIDGAMAYIGA